MSEPPTRFSAIAASGPEDDLKPLYDDIVAHGFGNAHGEPINWFSHLAVRPDILRAAWGLAKTMLAQGSLPPTLKQMVAMAVSKQNHCRYCAVTHTRALESMGVPDEVIAECTADPSLADIPPPHRGIIQFCVKAARDPNAITDEDYRVLRAAALSTEEICEIVMMAAFVNFINTWADVSGIAVDDHPDAGS